VHVRTGSPPYEVGSTPPYAPPPPQAYSPPHYPFLLSSPRTKARPEGPIRMLCAWKVLGAASSIPGTGHPPLLSGSRGPGSAIHFSFSAHASCWHHLGVFLGQNRTFGMGAEPKRASDRRNLEQGGVPSPTLWPVWTSFLPATVVGVRHRSASRNETVRKLVHLSSSSSYVRLQHEAGVRWPTEAAESIGLGERFRVSP